MIHCCCGGVDCGIASDNFDRSDSSSLGADWTESSGDWAIVSNQLDPPTSGTLLYAPDASFPAGEGIKWAVKVNFGGANGRLELLVDYVDANNYHLARFAATGASTATVEVFKRTAGTTTLLTTGTTVSGFSTSNDYTFAVCWTGEYIQASVNGGNTTADITTAHGGNTVGMLTLNVGTNARIDDAALTQFKEGCGTCGLEDEVGTNCCLCEDGLSRKYYKLVVEGIGAEDCSECARFNRTYIVPGPGIFICSAANFSSTCPAGSSDEYACSGAAATHPVTPPICGGGFVNLGGVSASIAISRAPSGTEYFLNVFVGTSGPVTDPGQVRSFTMHFRGSLGTYPTDPPDCLTAFNGMVLPFYCATTVDASIPDACDESGATVTVSHVE